MKIQNYGEIISFLTKKPLLSYVEFGSYQGEYIVAIDDDEDVQLFTGCYGSCSGCDWLEAKRDFRNDDVSEEDIIKSFSKEAEHPFATIPKDTLLGVDTDTFTAFLPKNVRGGIYEFDGAKLLERIKDGIKELKKTPQPPEETL